jgi:pyruvate kinase
MMMRRAKIVCTLGPATATREQIRALAAAGMDVARLNFSHGEYDWHRQIYEHVRQAAAELHRPIAVLADIAGPKIRLGDIAGGAVAVRVGDQITLSAGQPCDSPLRIAVNYPELPRDVTPGVAIFIDDGRIRLVVREVVGDDVVCDVQTDGLIGSRKGLNVPDLALSTPSITPKDRRDIEFARTLGVDYFALSFVRKPQDVVDAKRLTAGVPVIAKIEKPQAIAQLDEIADVADGLMVARGDLGIEVGFEKVPILQKRIIRAMNRRAKPVITATQMLETMVQNPRPTRAEVSDVANAILDGADAVMLSAESAAGKFPVEATGMMASIIREVESSAEAAGLRRDPELIAAPGLRNGIAHAAARCAVDLGLQAVAVYSETGASVALVSAFRPHSAIAGFSRHPQVLNRMALYWGVVPLFAPWAEGTDALVFQTEQELTRHGLARAGDHIALTFGLNDGGPPGTTMLKLWKIR